MAKHLVGGESERARQARGGFFLATPRTRRMQDPMAIGLGLHAKIIELLDQSLGRPRPSLSLAMTKHNSVPIASYHVAATEQSVCRGESPIRDDEVDVP